MRRVYFSLIHIVDTPSDNIFDTTTYAFDTPRYIFNIPVNIFDTPLRGETHIMSETISYEFLSIFIYKV